MNCPDVNELTTTKVVLADSRVRAQRDSQMQWRLRRLRAARRSATPKRQRLQTMTWLRKANDPRN